ncbi:hypothetical protein [Janibacter hoylei]|uniref:hypothetical protein n=1 Tax=Janibacter hoylei TaxID=364298 RepID=UPI002493063F|nr:hypothetical protein [Janibacter hoylei]
MQPSSLIFVLVVAIWAVYLLQYWIKRRDHLSTVRSVDRFSAAMRVLDDHRLRREATEPTPRSYAVTPARTARPEVTVKHAEAPARARMVEPVVGAPRRVRGLVLLTMLVLLPVVTLVAAFGPLTWWVALAWLVGTLAAFGWLRQAVQAEREARGRARAQQRRTGTAPAPRRSATAPAPRRAEPVAPEASPAPRRRAERIYDVAAPAVAAAAAAEVDEVEEPVATTPEPGTWEPTPVPRPVYTMKAAARREPAPAPAAAPAPTAAPVADDETPQVIDVEDDDLPAIAGWG